MNLLSYFEEHLNKLFQMRMIEGKTVETQSENFLNNLVIEKFLLMNLAAR
jgi:hypothetical protein